MSGYVRILEQKLKTCKRESKRRYGQISHAILHANRIGSAEPSIKFRKLIFACLCSAFAPGNPFASSPWKHQHYWKQREDYLFEMCRWCLWERGACVFEFEREMRHLFHKTWIRELGRDVPVWVCATRHCWNELAHPIGLCIGMVQNVSFKCPRDRAC